MRTRKPAIAIVTTSHIGTTITSLRGYAGESRFGMSERERIDRR